MKEEKITIEGQLRVKELLKERGLMMKNLAERLGIARESLTRAIQGNPQYSTLKAIADELGVTVPELFHTHQHRETSSVYGFVKVDGIVNEISSLEDLKKIIATL
jgi:transcriptional regulator with XRE-family HTH domain